MFETVGKLARLLIVDGPKFYARPYAALVSEAERTLKPHARKLKLRITTERALELADLVKKAYAVTERRDGAATSSLKKRYTRLEYIARSFEPTTDVRRGRLGSLGFIVRNRDEVIVAIRGTADDLDWMINVVGFFSTPSTINSDYLDLARAVAARVVFYLRGLKTVRRLTLVGHSMGGAVATLAHAGLASHFRRGLRIETVTFGAPAVGAKLREIGSRVYRIQRANDYVPLSLGDIEHAGVECLLTEDGQLLRLDGSVGSVCLAFLDYARTIARCHGEEQAKGALWRVFQLLKDADLSAKCSLSTERRQPVSLKLVEEHSIDAYVAALSRAVNR